MNTVLATALQDPVADLSHFPFVSRAALLERMPVLDEATYSAKHEMGVDGHQMTASMASRSNGHIQQVNGMRKVASKKELVDLLSFLPEEPPTSPQKSAGDALLDLFGSSNSVLSPGTFSSLSSNFRLLCYSGFCWWPSYLLIKIKAFRICRQLELVAEY